VEHPSFFFPPGFFCNIAQNPECEQKGTGQTRRLSGSFDRLAQSTTSSLLPGIVDDGLGRSRPSSTCKGIVLYDIIVGVTMSRGPFRVVADDRIGVGVVIFHRVEGNIGLRHGKPVAGLAGVVGHPKCVFFESS
jgi:hypothetical protein